MTFKGSEMFNSKRLFNYNYIAIIVD